MPTHVDCHPVDVVPDPKEVVYGLQRGPHGGGAVLLVGKLKLIQTEGVVTQQDDDPVQKLDRERGQTHASVVLTQTDP